MSGRRRNIFIIGAVGIVMVLAVSIIGALCIHLAPVFTLVLYAGLVAVTAVYAYCVMETAEATREQVYQSANMVMATMQQANASVKMAEESKRQAEIALNAQFKAVAPIIALRDPGKRGKTTVGVGWRNIGMGPALNFRCWIEDEEHPQLRKACRVTCCGAISLLRGNL